MVDPYVRGLLHSDSISICSENILTDDVTNYDVRLLPDVKPDTNECCKRIRSE